VTCPRPMHSANWTSALEAARGMCANDIREAFSALAWRA